MAAMFPFFDTGLQVAVAMLVLYGLLAATSLSVKLVEQGAVPGMLSQQVNAWWRIFPLISLALLAYPFGLVALAYLVYLLACLELAPFHGGHRLRYWIGALAIVAGISFLGWQHPGLAQRVLPCAIAIQVFYCGYRPDPRRLVWLLTLATAVAMYVLCLLYTSPSPRDRQKSRMPSSA